MNYNSESDESIENMKLDLLKAKYAHQKLKVNSNNLQSKNSNKLYNKDLSCKYDNSAKDVLHPKSSNFPTMSNQKSSSNRHSSVITNNENKIESNYEESEEEDEEDVDISKINDYVDYLLSKNKLSINDDVTDNFVLNPLHESSPLTANNNKSEAYQKCDRDYIMNTESTDILAQWRLRRKINEAQNSVKIEHQRHDMHIFSLKHQMNEINPPYSVSQCTYIPNGPNGYVSNKMVKSMNVDEYDQIPVRESMKNDKTFAAVSEMNDAYRIRTPTTTDASCQCHLNKTNYKKVDQKIQTNDTKKTRNVAIMTKLRSSRSSKLTDISTQTKFDFTESTNSVYVNRSSDWENKNMCHDYIDMAIEKTLQSQLFDRNYSPAMSSITSINESHNADAIRQMDIPRFQPENNNNNNNNNNVNNSLSCDDLLWNDQFEMDSENEFQEDSVLIDLRQRRQTNLKMLQKLSEKIRISQSSELERNGP